MKKIHSGISDVYQYDNGFGGRVTKDNNTGLSEFCVVKFDRDEEKKLLSTCFRINGTELGAELRNLKQEEVDELLKQVESLDENGHFPEKTENQNQTTLENEEKKEAVLCDNCETEIKVEG